MSPAAKPQKALDHIDLNLVSHRYVSGVLKEGLNGVNR